MSTKPAAGPWISVKERMPEAGKFILGWNEDYGPFVCCLSATDITDEGEPIWEAKNMYAGVGNPEPYALECDDEWPTHWTEIDEPEGAE